MTSRNRAVLDQLFEQGAIELGRSPLFDTPPQGAIDFDRVEGMLLGLAIGNALGESSEGLLPEERKARFGEVRDYLPNPRARNEAIGLHGLSGRTSVGDDGRPFELIDQARERWGG